MAIIIDARGVHRARPVPLGDCRSALKTEPLLPLVPLTPRHGGVAGLIRTEPATPVHRATPRGHRWIDKPREFRNWTLPVSGRTWRDLAILMSLLASLVLLTLAALEPPYGLARFGLVRAIAAHRAQVGFTGAAVLAAAVILLFAPP